MPYYSLIDQETCRRLSAVAKRPETALSECETVPVISLTFANSGFRLPIFWMNGLTLVLTG